MSVVDDRDRSIVIVVKPEMVQAGLEEIYKVDLSCFSDQEMGDAVSRAFISMWNVMNSLRTVTETYY